VPAYLNVTNPQAKLSTALDSGSPISIRTIDAAFAGTDVTLEERFKLKAVLYSKGLLTP
jgi:hypothetical protein